MKLMPWMVLLSLTLAVSCSGSKSAKKVNEETPQIELSDADEFIENPSEEQPADAATAATEPTSEEPVADSATEDVVVSNNEPLVQESTLENTSPAVINEPGTVKQYTVQKNETLMMIAFKLYGDYGRWKDLASQNREALKGGTVVRNGMQLNYEAPAEEFIWNPQGNPYLIKTGDTLGHISKEVYATVKKWKLLWENNRPLIKDPNKIYAGFTIYYLESGREVANEQ
jgi:nucleoid-associated protein YgaU